MNEFRLVERWGRRSGQLLAWVCVVLLCVDTALAATPELKPGSPQRYTVQPGDTLWGIANKFLREPWRWSELLQHNAINDPNLIYPGDVLVLSDNGGQPAVKVLRSRKVARLSPTVYSEPISDAIPTLTPGAIQPFLSAPLVVEDNQLDDSAYVAKGRDGKIVLGKYSVFFARGIDGDEQFYQIFRPGRKLVHPDTGEYLGRHVSHVGDARMLEPGETAKLEITSANEEILPGDRMLPATQNIDLPYYQPMAPDKDVHGVILDVPAGVNEMGPYSVVIISLGARDGVAPGHVLRIMRQEQTQKDPVTGELFRPPPQASGLLMAFRTFDKVSYALVMRTRRPVHLGDVLQTP